MPYNANELAKDTCRHWVGDDFAFYWYGPRRYGRDNRATEFVLDFKNAVVEAIELAVHAFSDFIAENEGFFCNELECRYVVPIPPSSAQRENLPCRKVCESLAARFPWLHHIRHPFGLLRVTSVRKSSYAGPGQRPDYELHRRTISFKDPPGGLSPGNFIMIDDVVTRGETSRACRDILLSLPTCNRVVGLFLGRTKP